MARLPLSGDIGILSLTRVQRTAIAQYLRRRQYAREKAWLPRRLSDHAGWQHAYLSVTGPILGTRESRHVNAVTSSPPRTSRPPALR